MHVPGKKSPLSYEQSLKYNEGYRTAFPDSKVTVESQIAEGDMVVTRLAYHGTNKGEFNGIPATNKKASTTGISIQKIVNGKIVEQTDEYDSLGMLQQLGAIHEMETTGKTKW